MAIAAAHVTRAAPKGLLIRLPQGMFFSMDMIAPNSNIQPMFPAPTANIKSISDQQQPIQKIPWSTPRRNACRQWFLPVQ